MKDVYIVRARLSNVTGKALAAALEARCKRVRPHKCSAVVYWGAKQQGESVPALNCNSKINPANKGDAAALLVKAGVPTPKLLERNYIQEWPVVVRTAQHQGGSGFWLCRDYVQIHNAMRDGGKHIYQFISIKDEWRVHVFRDRVIRCSKKSPLDGANMIVRSYNNGWRFTGKFVSQSPEDMKKVARLAVKALGLDFGAVDMALDTGGKWWVLEVNSAPGLEGKTLRAYTKAIADWLKEQEA